MKVESSARLIMHLIVNLRFSKLPRLTSDGVLLDNSGLFWMFLERFGMNSNALIVIAAPALAILLVVAFVPALEGNMYPESLINM
jgi:hypothetical protein